MELCIQRYLDPAFWTGRTEVVVLDLGGADVNGSYSELFGGPRYRYLGADLVAGEGVAVVLDDPYRIPLQDDSVDIVISGQMLEHCEFFWQTFAEMVRVMKTDGFMFLIAPSAGPIHSYPVDCYRFYPDAYRALAKYADCQLVDIWLDERGPWRDLVGVFAKSEGKVSAVATARAAPIAVEPVPPGPREVEVTRGAVDANHFLRVMHEIVQPERYLEIGVRHGASLALARADCRAVGVDPAPEVTVPLGADVTVFTETSDEFFRRPDVTQVLGGAPDVALIDGMHLFEYALRDFMNIERVASPTTFVLVDDIFPNHPRQASRDRSTQVWTGDVWKLHACLAQSRPDLVLIPIDTSPTGLLLIFGLNPTNRVLWDRYNPIVRKWSAPEFEDPHQSTLERKGALQPDSTEVQLLLTELGSSRRQQASRADLRPLIADIQTAIASASD